MWGSVPEKVGDRLAVETLSMGLDSVPGISRVQSPDSWTEPKGINHFINLLWKLQWKWGSDPAVTECYLSCFPLTIWFWADQGKHRMWLCSGSIIHSNCLYLKTPKNCNGLITLVTLWHDSPHRLTLRPFSLTEKSVTIWPSWDGWQPERGGAPGWENKEHGSWWKLNSLCGRWSTNLQSFRVHKTGLWGKSRH